MSRLPKLLVTAFRPMTPYEARALSFGQVTTARRAGATRWDEKRGTIEDPRIFGPEQDDCCACGKFVGIRYHRMICDRCGVKISESACGERSRRFGHIELTKAMPHPLAEGSAPLQAIPVFPAKILESESGRQLAPIYDSLVVASDAGKRDEVLRNFERLAEILTPAIEFTLRWGLSDSVVLAHGLALEDRASDPDPLAASDPAR
jgi:hypothetical protein